MNKISSQDLSFAVLSRIEAFIALMDLQSRVVLSNKTTAHLLGFRNEDEIIGITAFEMRCPAAEQGAHLIAQDADVQHMQKTFEYLDVHTYADGNQHILLTKKSPFYQDDQLTGVLCFSTEIKNETIQKILYEIMKADDSCYSSKDRSYVLTQHNKADFSERELECLFYLLRGYTAKEIAKRLQLSHRTVETYFERIKIKSGLANRSDLINYSLASGLINYIPKNVLCRDFSIKVG